MMKKRLMSLLSTLIMCLMLSAPAFASDLNSSNSTDALINATKQSLIDVSIKMLEIDGKDTTFTSGFDVFGRYVVIADNGAVQAISTEMNTNHIEVCRYENGTVTTHDFTHNDVVSEFQSIEPRRYTISGNDLYWGYAYSVGDAEEFEEGLLWDLDCGSPLYENFYGYDDNDATARTYAEDFMDYVNTMEACQREAKTINANAIDDFLSSIISICTDPTQVLAAIASSNASVREAEDAIYEASQASKQAFYCYRRFIAIASPLFP